MHQILISYKTMSTDYDICQKLIMEVVEPKFTKIVDGLKGSEGPVFDKDCNFYMVAPEVTKNDSFAGQVLSIDVENNKVWTGKHYLTGKRGHLFTCR